MSDPGERAKGMCSRVVLTMAVLASAGTCFAGPPTTFVRGFQGQPGKGCNGESYSHLGSVKMLMARQQAPDTRIEWKSEPLPAQITTPRVTFVFTGSMGSRMSFMPTNATRVRRSGEGNFSLWVNGRRAATFDAVNEPTRFETDSSGCEFLYDAIWVDSTRYDSSGYCYLTVPTDWVHPNASATLEVRCADIGTAHWFGLIHAEDAPLSIPEHPWRKFIALPTGAASAPPAGQEADYAWYLPQFSDPGILTPIGPPADPAETVVSPSGSLFYGAERGFEGAPQGYLRNALAFALYDESSIVPVGFGEPARQELVDGVMPMVTTSWKHGPLDIRETAFAEPLDGTAYQTGLERTLAWAAFDVTNRSDASKDVSFLAFHVADEKNPRPELSYRDGAVMLNNSALFSVQARGGLAVEFHPVFPAGTNAADTKDALGLLRKRKAVFNALAVQGQLNAGQTARIVFNRVFEFHDAIYWKAQTQPPVTPRELTERSFDKALQQTRTSWRNLSGSITPRFVTPDVRLNRIVTKAMLDGYFMTKRWDGRYIVFDSVGYRAQWDDASTKWFHALDLMGDPATSERLLDTLFARQGQRKPAGTRTHEGCFSDVTNTKQDGSSASWASCNGWALWTMAERARLADDRPWLEKHKQQILAGCDWIIRERRFSSEQKDNPCRGLINGRFVCDMPMTGEPVSGVGYFTYTDAISYMGLHLVAQLLSDWGHAEGKRLLEESAAYRQDIIAAIDRLTDRTRDPWYIPWVLHAPKYEDRYMYDVCGPINLAFGGVLPASDERIGHVIRWMIDHAHEGSLEAAVAGTWEDNSGAMFYSQDLAVVLLELGRVDEFLRVFWTLLTANVSHETLTTCEWKSNAQPHIHSIASLIRMFRTMLIQERDGGLYLLQGTPRSWLEDGKEIRIAEAPTWFGPLSLQCVSHAKEGRVQIQLKAPARIGQVPVHLKLRLPTGMRLTGATCNGKDIPDLQGEWLVLKGLQGDARIEARVSSP